MIINLPLIIIDIAQLIYIFQFDTISITSKVQSNYIVKNNLHYSK